MMVSVHRLLVWLSPVILLLFTISIQPVCLSAPSAASIAYYKLFTGGINQLLWDAVFDIKYGLQNQTEDFLLKSSSSGSQIIGSECVSSLLRLRSLYQAGDLVPFQCELHVTLIST